MTRWLLRFGYDGMGYFGWARQPGRPTVEGAIREGLARSALHLAVDTSRLEVASRTDAGVSARGNALTVSSRLPAGALLRAMNGLAPTIFFTAARPVSADFRVREAQWREYRYFLVGGRTRATRLSRLAARLPSMLDVRTFGRGIPVARADLRPLERLRVRFDGNGVRIDVRARSFVWGMVRKIVGGLLQCEAGRLPLRALIESAEGTHRLTLPLAPADALLLWEVRYPARWTTLYAPHSREQEAHLAEIRRRAAVRTRLAAAW